MLTDENKREGACCLILASLCFAGMGVFVRLAGDLPVFEKAMFRNFIAFLISYIMLKKQKVSIRTATKAPGFVALRAILGTLAIFCNFYAIDRIHLSDASMLNKMSPFYMVLFSWLMLKERVTKQQILIIIGAFLGSLLIVKPSGSNLLLKPALIAAIGGVLGGGALTSVRGCTQRGVPTAVIVFAFSAFSCVAFLPLFIIDFVLPTGKQFLFLLLCACCSAAGQFAITKGYSYAPASEISVFDYSQLMFSAIFGILLFGEHPDLLSFLGYVILIGLGVYQFFRKRS